MSKKSKLRDNFILFCCFSLGAFLIIFYSYDFNSFYAGFKNYINSYTESVNTYNIAHFYNKKTSYMNFSWLGEECTNVVTSNDAYLDLKTVKSSENWFGRETRIDIENKIIAKMYSSPVRTYNDCLNNLVTLDAGRFEPKEISISNEELNTIQEMKSDEEKTFYVLEKYYPEAYKHLLKFESLSL